MARLRMLAFAITAVVTLVGGWAAVPAQEGTPAGTPVGGDGTTETLFTFGIDDLPTGRGGGGVIHWTLEPGPQPLVLPAQAGPRFLAVESGEVTATEAGVEHPLAHGDVYVSADPGQELVVSVAGSEPASVFQGALSTAPQAASWDDQAHAFTMLMKAHSPSLPGGSGRLVIERLTVPPGSALPPFETRPLVWTDVGAGLAGATLEGGDLPAAWKAGKERLSGPGTLTLVAVPDGTRILLRNAGTDPLVLYRMTLIPETGSGVSATPPSGTPTA
jgi:hypothetical protein